MGEKKEISINDEDLLFNRLKPKEIYVVIAYAHGDVEKAAKDGKENLIPHMMEAFDNDATLGEVCDLLRSVWGEYRPKEII